jgi:hypothetical protein
METFVREIDLILSTFEFCATFSSTAVKTPNADGDQHDPANVPVLDKEARDVALTLVDRVSALRVHHISVIRCDGLAGRFATQLTQSCARFRE